MWAGIVFLVLVGALALTAAYLKGSLSRPRPRREDRPLQSPITGLGTEHKLP
jgi:hypothetical protein